MNFPEPTLPSAAATAPSMTVPYVDLAGRLAPLKERLLEAVGKVLDHGQFVFGSELREFEKRFAAACGVPYAVGVNSGTDALILALRALGVGPGDEVITAPNSYVATAAAIALTGARPVPADVGDDMNIDPEQIEAKIGPRTKALLPVHLTGRPAEMDAILDIARRCGLFVVEDAAQAVLAEYGGRRVGSFGDAGAFSLHPLKTLGCCGDGGVITTRDESLYKSLCRLRNLGLEDRDHSRTWSGNSRLDSMQAALLLVIMDSLDGWTDRRRENARFYLEALADVPGLILPGESDRERCVYHTFIIRADRRDELQQFLKSRGVEAPVHYPVPIHLHPAAAGLGHGRGAFPKAETQADRILTLPIHSLLTREQREHVSRSIREFYHTP
ncbi:MAG: DegT/DnrJ/EryC1/StrS family aminotransferase [Planctomycetaceae bacterium]